MLRQCVSIALVLSLVALSSSGMLMIFLNSFTFQLQMHPVHKIFGIIMTVAGCLHLYLNFSPIKRYLKDRKVLVVGVCLTIGLVFLYVVGLNKPLDPASVEQIEQLMLQMGSKG